MNINIYLIILIILSKYDFCFLLVKLFEAELKCILFPLLFITFKAVFVFFSLAKLKSMTLKKVVRII